MRFHGDVIPELDIVAETSAADVTARIAVTGPANQPTLRDHLACPACRRTRFCRASCSSSRRAACRAFQALELANAVATLSGRFDAFEGICARRSASAAWALRPARPGGGLLGLGRAINDRISVGVTTGARPQDNGVNVDLDVTRHLRLQAGVDASGGSSAGVGAEWEYK